MFSRPHEAPLAFGRRFRLCSREQILLVQRKGRRYEGANFVLCALRSACEQPRIGISVSRQVGKAVTRNRVKRWIRETFRKNRQLIGDRVDLVVGARVKAATATHVRVEQDLTSLFRRVGKQK